MKAYKWLVVVIFCLALTIPSAFSWYDTNYLLRRSVTINNAGVAQTDFQTLINLTYDSDMSAGFDNLLMTWYNSTSGIEAQIPFCLGRECTNFVFNNGTLINLTTSNSSFTDIVVNVKSLPASSTSTIYIYYSNSTPVSYFSSSDTTWNFGDEFNDASFNTTKWSQPSYYNSGGTRTVNESGGVVNLTVIGPSGDYANMGFNSTEGYNASVTPLIIWNSVRLSRQVASDFGNSNFMYLRYGTWDFMVRYYVDTPYQVCHYVTCETYTISPDPMNDGKYHVNVVILKDAGIPGKLNDTTYYDGNKTFISTHNDTPNNETMWKYGIRLSCYDSKWRSANIDYVRVRKYSATEPTFAIGSEQNQTLNWISITPSDNVTYPAATNATCNPGVAWYYSSHSKRVSRVINNTANPNNLIDYQVDFDVSYDADMKTDFADLRFTWYNNTSGLEQPANFYVKNKVDSTYANLTVKIPFIAGNSTETIYMYYGNSSATSLSNGTNAYTFYDNPIEDTFTSFNQSSQWKEYNSGANTLNASTSNGYIQVNASTTIGVNHWIMTNSNFTIGKKFYFDNLSLGQPAVVGNDMIRYIPGGGFGPPEGAAGYLILEYYVSAAVKNALEIGVSDTLYKFNITYPQNILLSWRANNITVQNETKIYANTTTDIPTQEKYMTLLTQSGYPNETFVKVARIRVEEYSTPEPVPLSWSSEDTSPTFYRNGTLLGSMNDYVTLGAGVWNYTCKNGVDTDMKLLTVNTNSSGTVNLTITPSSPINYGTSSNATCSGNNPEPSWVPYLYRDNVLIGANETAILPAGTYNYTCAATATNYSAASTTQYYTVNKGNLYSNPTSLAMSLNAVTINKTGLIGYWRFESETANYNTSDFSGNGNNPMCSTGNCPTLTAGRFGNAYYFDGVNDEKYVLPSAMLNLSGNQTLTAWVKYTTNETITRGIVEKRGATGSINYRIYEPVSGKIACEWWDGTNDIILASTNLLNNNQWHHIACVRNTQTDLVYIYVDGVQNANTTDTTDNNLILNNGNLWFGRGGVSPQYFNGSIDEVSLWNKPLTAEQIRLLYGYVLTGGVNFTTSVNDTGTSNNGYYLLFSNVSNTLDDYAMYHPFDLNSGTTAKDMSLNGNDGTLVNATWVAGKFGNGIEFTGTDSYAKVSDANSLDLSGGLTLSAWIYPHTNSSNKDIIAKDGNYDLYMSSGCLKFYSNGTSTACGGNPVMNAWTHAVAVFNGTHVMIYMNGNLMLTESKTLGSVNSAELVIGAYYLGPGSYNEFFDGIIDEARIYPRALSQSEISTMYNATAIGVSDTASKPLGYYYYQVIVPETQNYTMRDQIIPMNVTPLDANVQVYPVTQSIQYGNSVTQYCTSNYLPCNIYRNGVLISNNTAFSPGAGTYAYTANISDTFNYTNYQDTEILTITANSSSVTLNVTPASPIIYETQTTANCTDTNPETDTYLWLNGTETYYTGFSFPVGNGEGNPTAITSNGTYLYATGSWTNKIWEYYLNGTSTGNNYNVPCTGSFVTGLDWNGTYYHIACAYGIGGIGDGFIARYYPNWTYANWNFTFNVSALQDSAFGVAKNNTYFWSTERTNGIGTVRYFENGTYDTNISAPYTTSLNWYELQYNNTFFFGVSDTYVKRYFSNGTLDTRWTLDTTQQEGHLQGMYFNGTHFYVAGYDTDTVYVYAENLGLYMNTTNPDIRYLGVGVWNYTCIVPTTQNYTGNSTSQLYTVTQKNANIQVYPVTQSHVYPYTITQYCTDDSTLLTCNNYRNDSSITNGTSFTPGIGTYAYKANITDTYNYTNYQDLETLTITANTSSVTLSITPATPITYEIQSNATCTDTNPEALSYLYRNNSAVLVDAYYWSDVESQHTNSGTWTTPGNAYDDNNSTYAESTGTGYLYQNYTLLSNYTMTMIRVAEYEIYMYGSGGTSHSEYHIAVYNYTSAAWEDLWVLAHGGSGSWYYSPVLDVNYSSYISGNKIMTRGYANNYNGGGIRIFEQSINYTTAVPGSQEITYLPAGVWNYTCNVSATGNYSGASTSQLYTVNKKNANVAAYPTTQSQVYEDTPLLRYCTDDSAFLTCNLYQNGSLIVNGTNPRLGAGVYTYNANLTDNANYTNYQSATNTVIITQKNANVNVYPVTQSITYGNSVTQYCTDASILLNCVIYRNETAITNNTVYLPAAGAYAYKANISDGTNYTSYTDSETLTVTKVQLTVDLYLNGTKNADKVYSYTATNATGTISSNIDGLLPSLYRDGVYKGQTENIFLPAGNYTYKVNATGNENYTSNSTGVSYKAYVVWAPQVAIQQPANLSEQYLYPNASKMINFNYTVSDLYSTTCWYSLDSGTNTSLPSCANDTLNITQYGNHSVRLYSSESYTGLENTTLNNFYVGFINKWTITDPSSNPLSGTATFFNSTYNFNVSFNGTIYLNTSDLPSGTMNITFRSPNRRTEYLQYLVNNTTQIDAAVQLLNSGILIRVYGEDTLSPYNWWKVFMTNTTVNGTGAYTTQLSVGKGYPGTPFMALLDDDMNTAISNSNANFTYNFGYTNAVFAFTYAITNSASAYNNITLRAWNNTAGAWVTMMSLSKLGNATKTTENFTIDNSEGNAVFGDLTSLCNGYYCPLWQLTMEPAGSANISAYDFKLISPYTYDRNGFAVVNYTNFILVTGSSRFRFESPVFAPGLYRTYFVSPSVEEASTLDAYLNPNCHVQPFQVYVWLQNPSQTPIAIPNATLSIYKQIGSNTVLIDQQKSDAVGAASLCVESGFPYSFSATAPGYSPEIIYDEVFPTNVQLIYVYLKMTSSNQNLTNPYYVYTNITPSGGDISIPKNYTCAALAPYGNAQYSYFIVNRTPIFTGYPSVNISDYPPTYSNASLPFGLSGYNNTTEANYYTGISYSPSGAIFSTQLNLTGKYTMYCGVVYNPYNETIVYTYSGLYNQEVTQTVWYTGTSLAPSGASLKNYISPVALYIVALIIDMMITGFFVVRFGVRSGFIFILIWGLLVTILSGWGQVLPTGVFALGVLFWLTLMVFPYRRD